MKAWFALGGDREPVVFDFRRWLEGEDINMNRITGEVDTDIPFCIWMSMRTGSGNDKSI